MKTVEAKNRSQAKKQCPEAIIFVKVGWGCYACFYSDVEYRTWKRQR